MARPPKAKQPIKIAALRLFVEQGIHATGIREIAIQAGYSEAALYRHWENKEDLVNQLFIEHLDEVVSRLDQEFQGPGTTKERLTKAISSLYQLYDEQPFAFRFILLVQHDIGPSLGSDVHMPHQSVEAFIKASYPHFDHTRIVLIAGALVGIFIEASSRVIYGHLPSPMQQYAEQVGALCSGLLDGLPTTQPT